MAIRLVDAINNSKTFAELAPIAKQLKAELSFWGRRYVVFNPDHGGQSFNIVGEAPIGALVERTQQIIKEHGFNRYNYPEFDISLQLDVQVERLYEEDSNNIANCNILTRICMVFRGIYSMWFTPNYKSHLFRWKGDGCCYVELERHVLAPEIQRRSYPNL